MGAEIRRLRVEAGLTITELAELANRHPSFVARIRAGSACPAGHAAGDRRGAGEPEGGNGGRPDRPVCRHVGAPESVWPGWPERIAKRRAKKRRREELEARRYEAVVSRV
jgi:hypothetical protein